VGVLEEPEYGLRSRGRANAQGSGGRASTALTTNFGYVRFHGRNAGHWWQHEQAYERYDYLYQEPELEEWALRIHSLAQGADRIFVTFNNHYKGQSITNARMMQRMLQF